MDYSSPPSDRCLHEYKRPGIYPSSWRRGRIQKVMLKWANNQCENCGISGDDALLHVHHIRWGAKHDCSWENLVVVCVSCHVKIHNHKWQPGRPWTLTPTPPWMTHRGYKNTEEVSLDTTESAELIEMHRKHIKLAIALQRKCVELLRSLEVQSLPQKEAHLILREAGAVLKKGTAIENKALKELSKLGVSGK